MIDIIQLRCGRCRRHIPVDDVIFFAILFSRITIFVSGETPNEIKTETFSQRNRFHSVSIMLVNGRRYWSPITWCPPIERSISAVSLIVTEIIHRHIGGFLCHVVHDGSIVSHRFLEAEHGKITWILWAINRIIVFSFLWRCLRNLAFVSFSLNCSRDSNLLMHA